MNTVRCSICRQQLPTLKTLKSHYMNGHSKIQIIRELLKSSIMRSTPNLLTKPRKRKKSANLQTLYSHKNVHITYSDNTIIIEDESSSDNLIEFTFDESRNCSVPLQDNTNVPARPAKPEDPRSSSEENSQSAKRRSKRAKRSKKMRRLHIGITKINEAPKSLDEHTGQFYECHCMERNPPKASSDTESCSDTGRTFYCGSCGGGYGSAGELAEHEKAHQVHCRICNRAFTWAGYKEHFEQHLLRIYVCHLCGFEFIFKEALAEHFGHHFEQQTFEDILNMEQDYNMYSFCNTNFASGDHDTNIRNILLYLTYPYDHYYCRNMFIKVVCDICLQDFYIYDYERHLKIAHFLQ